MPDIQDILPKESKTVNAIYKHYEKLNESNEHRWYLGASSIGHKCSRYLWYCFRGCCEETFQGRMLRLFKTGDIEEERLANDLKNIGCTVHVINEETGKQFEISDFCDNFSGHLDGCVLGIPDSPNTWHVFEAKSHNLNSFNKLLKDGLEISHPKYYAQAQVYMHYTGMTRCWHGNVCKDTDEIKDERIHYKKEKALALIEKAEHIINSTSPPIGISEREDYYECKYCSAKRICFGDKYCALPLVNRTCRTCCHSTPILDKDIYCKFQKNSWNCEFYNKAITIEDQIKACDNHLVIPGLITFAEPIDGGQNWVQFKTKDDREFVSCPYRPDPGGVCFSTNELMKLSQEDLFNPLVIEAKKQGCIVKDKDKLF